VLTGHCWARTLHPTRQRWRPPPPSASCSSPAWTSCAAPHAARARCAASRSSHRTRRSHAPSRSRPRVPPHRHRPALGPGRRAAPVVRRDAARHFHRALAYAVDTAVATSVTGSTTGRRPRAPTRSRRPLRLTPTRSPWPGRRRVSDFVLHHSSTICGQLADQMLHGFGHPTVGQGAAIATGAWRGTSVPERRRSALTGQGS
jgi:hypothetical protein